MTKPKKKNALNIDPPFQLFFCFFNSQKLTYFGLVNSLSNPPIYFEGFAVYVAKLDSCLLDKHDMADTISATIESGNFSQLIIVRFQYSIRSKILLKSSSWQESKRSKKFLVQSHMQTLPPCLPQSLMVERAERARGRSVIPATTRACLVTTNDHWSVYEN